MDKIFEIVGNLVATVGILTCLLAVFLRITGSQWIMGYEPKTLFMGGIALMVMACLSKLQAVSLSLNK